MTANERRTHRRAAGSSGSFVLVRDGTYRGSRGPFASSSWPGVARLPLERVAFWVPRALVLRSAKGASRRTLPWARLARACWNVLRGRYAAPQDEVRWVSRSIQLQRGLAFALLLIFSSPARADFRVCNKTHALINIAVGTDAGEAFRTEGWWVATPGSCATPVRGPLKSRFVYLYATDIDGVDLVAGTATMCIDRGKFIAFGADNCWRRGLQAVTFAEIDTLDSSDWTTFLTDPRK